MCDLVMAGVTTAGPSAATDSVALAQTSDHTASDSTVLSVRPYSHQLESTGASDLIQDWTSIFHRLDLLAERTRLTGYEQMEYYSLRNQLSVLRQSHITSEKINDQLRGQVADLRLQVAKNYSQTEATDSSDTMPSLCAASRPSDTPDSMPGLCTSSSSDSMFVPKTELKNKLKLKALTAQNRSRQRK